MATSYIIRIDLGNKNRITNLLRIKPTCTDYGWEISATDSEIKFLSFLNKFAKKNKQNIKELENIGVHKKDITIWYYYEYNSQCNIEFIPEEIKLIAELGFSLCISCWNI